MTKKNIYHRQFILDSGESDKVIKFFSGYFACNGIKQVEIYYEENEMIVEIQGTEDTAEPIGSLK